MPRVVAALLILVRIACSDKQAVQVGSDGGLVLLATRTGVSRTAGFSPDGPEATRGVGGSGATPPVVGLPSSQISIGDTILLRAHTGNRITVAGSTVHAKWDHSGSWQQFVVESKKGGGALVSGDTIFLRAHTGKRVTVQNTAVHAKWSHQGLWQAFVVERKEGDGGIVSGDAVFLRAHTGKRVTVQGRAVHAKWDHRGSWQALTIEKVPVGVDSVTTTTTEPRCDPSSLEGVFFGMSRDCQTLVTGSLSYEERCLCYLQVPSAAAVDVDCPLLLAGDNQTFRAMHAQCGQDFKKEVWVRTRSDVCCHPQKVVSGNAFDVQTTDGCGALALRDPDCNPNQIFFADGRPDRCYCVPRGRACDSVSTCRGWNLWEPETPRVPGPPVAPTVTPSGYTKVLSTSCKNDCVDTIAQYPPYSKSEAECEALCDADPRCKLYEMAHCGHQCILLTHCALSTRSWCSERHPGTALFLRPGWQPLVVTLGEPGDFEGGQGIWGMPASECGSNVYGDNAKGRCDPGLAKTVGRISICETEANCIASNITSAQACAEKAVLISFCEKDYIEWRASKSSCYCAPIGHSYVFSAAPGGAVYPITATEP